MLKVFLYILVCRTIHVYVIQVNTKNNNNFEIIKVICYFKTVYVCTLYYLKRTFIHKIGVGCSQGGPQIV